MPQAMPLECRGTEEPFVRQNLYVRGWLRMRDLPISDMSEMKGLCRCRVPSETVARNAFNFFLGNLNHCLFFVSHRALLCAYREDERLPRSLPREASRSEISWRQTQEVTRLERSKMARRLNQEKGVLDMVGLLIHMGGVNLPRMEDHWSTDPFYDLRLVRNCIPRDFPHV